MKDEYPQPSQTPQSFFACLPWIWTRILFPGRPAQSEAWRWIPLLVLLILPAIVLYPCTSFHLFEPDEGRYAEVPREMLVHGEWIVPLLQSEPYLDKPPLLYWLVMISYTIFGIHDWSARLIPALAVHGCILLVYLFGRRWVGERSAFWGALLLAIIHGFEGMARLLLLDGLLALLVTATMFCLFEAIRGQRFGWLWWLGAAVLCGLGVLTKGPVIVLLVLPPVWLHRWLTLSNFRVPWQAWGGFGLVTTAIALPWYVAICWRLPEFAYHFLWVHNVMRFVQPFDHIRPVWFYLPILFACLLPVSLLMPHFVWFLFSSRSEMARQRSPAFGFLLMSSAWMILFFSLSGSKLPTYILPAFPPLLLAFGTYLVAMKWHRSRIVHAVIAASYVLMVFGNYWLMPWYAESRSPMNRPEVVWDYCGDRTVPVVCYPRHVDSVSFYVGRDDFRSFRSKRTPQLIQYLQKQPRTVVLFSHRHSCEQLKNALPPHMRMVGRSPFGLCDMAIVEKRAK